MKDRYFSVCRKLIRNRPWPGDDISKTRLITSFLFDKGIAFVSCLLLHCHHRLMSILRRFRKDRETMRKNYLISLESRTPSEIAEEEALYIELKRTEQTERTFRRERDELLRTILGIDSGLPDLPIEDDTGPPASAVESRSGAPEVAPNKKNTKRRGAGMSLGDLGGGIGGESPASPASAGISTLTPRSRQSSTKSSAYGAFLCPLVRSLLLTQH